MSQIKEWDKIIARDLSKTEISNMPDGEFKVMIIKILDLKKEWRTSGRPLIIRQKHTLNEIESTPDGINSRLEEAEEQISNLVDRVVESNQAEQLREKNIMQNENRLRELSNTTKHNYIPIIGIPKGEEREQGAKLHLKK